MRIDPTSTAARGIRKPNGGRGLLAEWASRGLLALLFVLGTLAMAASPPGASRSESVIEGGSGEFESCAPANGKRIQTKRRAYLGGRPPMVSSIEGPRAPRVLVLALGVEAPRPRWQIPRRVVPAADDDDDDDELG
jgi:hypothetical protein